MSNRRTVIITKLKRLEPHFAHNQLYTYNWGAGVLIMIIAITV